MTVPANYTGGDEYMHFFTDTIGIEGIDWRFATPEENKTCGDIYLIKTGRFVEVKTDYRTHLIEPTGNIYFEDSSDDKNGEHRISGINQNCDEWFVICPRIDASPEMFWFKDMVKLREFVAQYRKVTKYPDEREKKKTMGYIVPSRDCREIDELHPKITIQKRLEV